MRHREKVESVSYECLSKLGIGWLMGLAVVIPGVSAGTVALVMGIYRESLRDIGALRLRPLVPLAGGLVGGIIFGVHLVDRAVAVRPAETSAFFLGVMVVAVLGFVLENRPRGAAVAASVAGCGVAWWLAVLSLAAGPARTAADVGVGAMFRAGAAGVSSMILPGVSGGTVLILMGLYYATIDMLVRWDWVNLGSFVIGGLAGIFLAARIIRFMMRRWEPWVMASLVGLMVGSMRALIPVTWSVESLLAMLAGGGLSLLLFCGGLRRIGGVGHKRNH